VLRKAGSEFNPWTPLITICRLVLYYAAVGNLHILRILPY